MCKYCTQPTSSARVVQKGLVDSLVLPVKKKKVKQGSHTSPPASGTTRVYLPVL